MKPVLIARNRQQSEEAAAQEKVLRDALEKAQAQAARLERFIHLERRAYAAESREELGFVCLNDTLSVTEYREAALWWRGEGEGGSGHVEGLAGVSDVAKNGVFPSWLAEMLGAWADAHPVPEDKPAATAPIVFTRESVSEGHPDNEAMWQEYLPPCGLWTELPLASDKDGRRLRAALVLWRDAPWKKSDQRLMALIAPVYADAWKKLPGGRRDWLGKINLESGTARVRALFRQNKIRAAVAVILLGMAAFPVHQSVLAPAEVVAKQPLVVRSPLQGVVESIAVEPNQPVRKGDLLVKMDARDLKGQLQAAQQNVAVSREQLRQTEQDAFYNERSKMSLGVLKRRYEQALAEADYLAKEYARTEIRAERDGIAVFADREEWKGRPVAVGERIMTVADPREMQLEAEIPVADIMTFEPQAPVRFFLNSDPTSPVDGMLRQTAYRASPTPEGTLAYKARADFEAEALQSEKLRIGLRGTAKIYGEKTALGLYLLRRPISVLRLWLGA